MDAATGERREEEERDPLEDTARFELLAPPPEEVPAAPVAPVEPPPEARVSGRHRIRIVPITPAPAPIAFTPPAREPEPWTPVEEPQPGPPVVRSRDRPRCPYCHEDLSPEVEKAGCQSCLAWHHAACWKEARGRCATCGRRRKSDVTPPPRGGRVARWLAFLFAVTTLVSLVGWAAAEDEAGRVRYRLQDAWRSRSASADELYRAQRELSRLRAERERLAEEIASLRASAAGDGWGSGSTSVHVELVQGRPQDITVVDGGQVWRYGESTITFSPEGRVLSWVNHGELRVSYPYTGR